MRNISTIEKKLNKRPYRGELTTKWTKEEEIFLYKLATSKLKAKWTVIAQILKNKSPNQCLYKFRSLSKKNKSDYVNCEKSDNSDFLVQDSRVRNYFEEKVKNCGDLEKYITSGFLKNKREREMGESKQFYF